jgi:uncharacterized membrane protein YkvA (DUF1232 family)
MKASGPLRLLGWAKTLRRDLMTLWFVLRHPSTPWVARLLAALVTAYALSPVDLIPDFIPVLGWLDDLLIVPAGVWLLLRLVPPPVVQACREQAAQWLERHQGRKPRSLAGLAIVVGLWLLAAWLVVAWLTD